MNWAVDGGIERRFHPKDRFKDQFRRFYPALARTACAEPLRPFKKVHQRSLKPPSRPQLDYRLVRLGTNPIGSAAYLSLPLPPVYLPLEALA